MSKASKARQKYAELYNAMFEVLHAGDRFVICSSMSDEAIRQFVTEGIVAEMAMAGQEKLSMADLIEKVLFYLHMLPE